MYGLFSDEYDDTEFSAMDLVGVPPYGPIASAAEESDLLEVAIVIAIADIMTGILSLEYLVCFECPTDVVVLTLLPYAVTLAYFCRHGMRLYDHNRQARPATQSYRHRRRKAISPRHP